MVSEAIAGLGAFTQMFSIAKSLKDTNDTVVRNAAVAELWEQSLAGLYVKVLPPIPCGSGKSVDRQAGDCEKL